MKNILLAIFIAISINSFGQTWTDYQVDSLLTVNIPDNYKTRGTLEQRMISAQIDNGMIIISILPNAGENTINVQSEDELIKSYKEIEKEAINVQHAQLIKDEIFENSGLKMIRFSCKASMHGERQIRHCLLAFVNEKMYSVIFAEVESMTNEMSATREKLFSSMRFAPNLGLKNQMSNKAEVEKEEAQGQLIGYITVCVLLPAILFWSSKRKKKKRIMAPAVKK